MPRFSDILTLISKKTPTEKTNPAGFLNPMEEHLREVRGNIQSVWHTFAFKSRQEGTEARFKFTMRTADYEGEDEAELEGKRYKISSVERSASGELSELLLSDLAKRGKESGVFNGQFTDGT